MAWRNIDLELWGCRPGATTPMSTTGTSERVAPTGAPSKNASVFRRPTGLFAIGVVTVLVVLGVGTVAMARLPSLRSDLIVPGKSIGGLALGDTVAQANLIWGSARCSSFPKDNLIQCAMDGSAVNYFAKWRTKRIYSIAIFGTDRAGPLDRNHLHTQSGIGLGSTETEVLAAYPHAKVLSSHGRVAIQLSTGHGRTGFGLNYVRNGGAGPPRPGAKLEVTSLVISSGPSTAVL